MDGLPVVARLILAAALLGSVPRYGIGGRAGLPARAGPGFTGWFKRLGGEPADPARPAATGVARAAVLLAISAGLMFGAAAWWSALAALVVLLAPVVPVAVRTAGDRNRTEALSYIIGSIVTAIPAVVVLEWRDGPDTAAWLAGLSPLRQVIVVGFAAALATVVAGRARPAAALAAMADPALPPAAPPVVRDQSPAANGPAAAVGQDTAPALPGRTAPGVLPAPGEPLTVPRGAASLLRPTPDLTIGMATYDDFDGVYFTLQALRLYQDLADTELLVVDNYGCAHTAGLVRDWAGGRYVLATDVVGTAATKELVFRHASGRAVLCCDSHVLFVPGAIARLRRFHRAHPDCADLLQGPLLYDDGRLISTHFDPVWRGQMWGIWATDPRGFAADGEPFEIPMQGLGAFSCRTDAWLGFHPGFRGFGGEEGYLHEKYRQAGRRCLCLPWLRWMHRFGRPRGPGYPLTIEDKLRNYVIGHTELGLDLAPVLAHFEEFLPAERVRGVARAALAEAGAP